MPFMICPIAFMNLSCLYFIASPCHKKGRREQAVFCLQDGSSRSFTPETIQKTDKAVFYAV